MKKILYMAAVVLAAAACSRESLVPENVTPSHGELIPVTLRAGIPETRTELGLVNNRLYPFWTSGDRIGVISAPDFAGDEVNYPYTNVSDNPLVGIFEGQMHSDDSFFAYYPYTSLVGEQASNEFSYVYHYYNSNYSCADIVFHVPAEQHPSPTSFDESADLLISKPFDIDDAKTTIQDLEFTRVNAIVKVVLEDRTSEGFLTGENVYSITLGGQTQIAIDVPYKSPRSPGTRLGYTGPGDDDDEEPDGLTGWADYELHTSYDLGFSIYESWDINGYVTATYSSVEDGGKGLYQIGADGEAAYFIVFPVVVSTNDGQGLPITVITDNYAIHRTVYLPEDVALQPSRVTTLKIGLYDMDDPDHGYEMSISEKTIAFEKPVVNLLLNDATYGGTYFNLDSYGFIFDYADIAAIQWSYSQEGIVSINFNDASVYTDKIDGDADSQISGLWVEGLQAGETTVTATLGNLTASFKVKVVSSSPEIQFDDDNVKAICLREWDFNGDGVFTEFEASRVDALTNYATGNGETNVFWGKQIGSFSELQYFTGLTTLDYAFSYSTLESVQLPQDFKGTTQYAFQYCANLESVVLPEGMTEISSCAFWYCESLTDITLPSTIKYIGGLAFYDCSSLASINLPNSLIDLGDSAFEGCSSLQSIEIPSSLGTIPSDAFMNCSSLRSVTLNEGLGGINPGAFFGCALHEIAFPTTLEFVSTSCFGGNPFRSGEDTYHGITFYGTTPPEVHVDDDNYTAFTGWHWNSDANDWSDYGIHIYVPNESLDAYAALPGLSNSGMNIFVGF